MEKKPLPSQSLRPGPARWAALLTADPAVWVARLVAAALEGMVYGFLRWRDNRKPDAPLPTAAELERQARALRECERREAERERELERDREAELRRERELEREFDLTNPQHKRPKKGKR
jgi:hypothetical protein